MLSIEQYIVEVVKIKKKKDQIINMNESFWREKLSTEQFKVLVQGGTESACHNRNYHNKEKGIYVCAACNNILFSSSSKYSSGSGWPSFYDELKEGKIGVKKDYSHGMERDEVYCSRCGGHLGHQFEDGPKPTGLRYCINSAALTFLKQAYLAMGCFWGPEALFAGENGVYFTRVGYAGGGTINPDYQNIKDHTETVEIVYDPTAIKYHQLLNIYWENHDPWREPFSRQYQSIIFYNDQEQKRQAINSIQQKYDEKGENSYLSVKALDKFYQAEEYHQKYILKSESELFKLLIGLFNNQQEQTYSRLLTKLNAYLAGYLSLAMIIKELRNTYKYLNHHEELEKVISDLKNSGNKSK